MKNSVSIGNVRLASQGLCLLGMTNHIRLSQKQEATLFEDSLASHGRQICQPQLPKVICVLELQANDITPLPSLLLPAKETSATNIQAWSSRSYVMGSTHEEQLSLLVLCDKIARNTRRLGHLHLKSVAYHYPPHSILITSILPLFRIK